jgi:basic amino acid/polyamine antiporter, APA family
MATFSSPPSRLARKLGRADATVIGLGAMIGAGIFVAPGAAAAAAGSGLLLSLGLAGGLAALNAFSMVRLATRFPESGGAYAYARRLLGPLWGYLAGWCFVVGKLASCAAMALAFSEYVFPGGGRSAALLAVGALSFLNCCGVKKTAGATRIILGLALLTLGAVLFASFSAGKVASPVFTLEGWSWRGVMSGAGIFFFAFAGYARVATLGEEVNDPARTIPFAVGWSIAITFALYVIVTVALLWALPLPQIAAASSPLALAVQSGPYSSLAPLVRIGAGVACLGVLLSLLAGISRTVFAMAAQGDLPKYFSRVHEGRKVPLRAEAAVGFVVMVVLAWADIRHAIGFSSFAVLLYYALAHAAALRLPGKTFSTNNWASAGGLIICLVVAAHLPSASVGGGLALFLVGSLVYWGRTRKG